MIMRMIHPKSWARLVQNDGTILPLIQIVMPCSHVIVVPAPRPGNLLIGAGPCPGCAEIEP